MIKLSYKPCTNGENKNSSPVTILWQFLEDLSKFTRRTFTRNLHSCTVTHLLSNMANVHNILSFVAD